MADIETRNSDGKLHSVNDEPALISEKGSKHWYKNGLHHRDDGKPAAIYYVGDMSWHKDGKLHRDDGEPAIMGIDGYKAWYINGIELNKKQVKLLRKINASEIKYLPWLLNEDPLLNCVIERRLNE